MCLNVPSLLLCSLNCEQTCEGSRVEWGTKQSVNRADGRMETTCTMLQGHIASWSWEDINIMGGVNLHMLWLMLQLSETCTCKLSKGGGGIAAGEMHYPASQPVWGQPASACFACSRVSVSTPVPSTGCILFTAIRKLEGPSCFFFIASTQI